MTLPARTLHRTHETMTKPHDELLDLLADMKHDLGKYLVMPVAMLPHGADEQALREGLRRGLLRTMTRGDEVRGAEALWESFLEEGGDALRGLPGFDDLSERVQTAVAWTARLDDPEPLDREALLRDLRAVGTHIAAMMSTEQR